MSKSKANYYDVDAGFFPATIKLCFDNHEFQKILKDYDIRLRATALDLGIAETHMISDGRQAIIILTFNLEECDIDPAYLAGTIAHEATHCVSRIFDHIGENPDEVGEETRAYLTEHIVRQLTIAVSVEKAKNARKANRSVSRKKSEGAEGDVPEVDIVDNGSAGQNSPVESENSLHRAQNRKWRFIGTSKNRISSII